MQAVCDLHTHSTFSDGSDTPLQIVQKAVELGLSAVALTDHNMVDGLPDFLEAAADQPIKAISGAEFSVDYNGTELHLLGLFLPPSSYAVLSGRMQAVHEAKEQSNVALVEALNRAGYAIDYEAVKRAHPSGKVNRSHIAKALTEAGYTTSMGHAFDTLLSKDAGYYTEPERLTAWEMIDLLRSFSAVPVLAHPFLNLQEEELEAFLPQARRRGLIGMECLYTTFSAEQTACALSLAKANGLLPSGGSDYHGDRKPGIELGVGHGDLRIPLEWAQRLEESAGSHG